MPTGCKTHNNMKFLRFMFYQCKCRFAWSIYVFMVPHNQSWFRFVKTIIVCIRMNVSDVVGENIEDNIWHLQSLSILISFECQKVYILRPTWDQLRKMQLQGTDINNGEILTKHRNLNFNKRTIV